MENFLLTFNGIMPIVCLIGFGYLLKRLSFISSEGFAQIDKLCFNFLVPIMLFDNIYAADISALIDTKALIFLLASLIAVFIFSMRFVPLISDDSRGQATIVHALGHGNLTVMGLPLIASMFGAGETALYSVMVAFSQPLINGFMVYEHTRYDQKHLNTAQLLKKICTAPYLVGTMLGFLCNILGIRFPVFLESAIHSLKSIASPLCLISMGGAFVFSGFGEYRKQILFTSITKCVLIPLIVLPLAVLLRFRGTPLLTLTITFTAPAAVATYSYSVSMYGDPKLASQLVVYSTVLSLFTIFLWIFGMLQLSLF